jgi:uncharacterized membrane protein YuzA (DUF378 family)
MNAYMQKKLVAFAVLLLVIGGLNWGYVAFTGKDLISYLFGKGLITNSIFLAVGLAALALAFYRDTYLPFLGTTIMPCSLLDVRTPEGADFEAKVLAKPGAKVLYWAAEPANKDLQTVQDYEHAYLAYRNAGVAIADSDGIATLKVRKPQPYSVPLKGDLDAHIHYRICYGDGFLGRVDTIGVDGKEWFENVDSEKPEDESFTNVGAQEELATATGPAINYPVPERSIGEINGVAATTAIRSLMPQDGAFDESPRPGGYPIDEAYRPAGPANYTPVNYS